MDFVQKWDGEIWGCNSIYLEIASGDIPRLDTFIGDKPALLEALEYKKKYGFNYRVIAKTNAMEKIPGTVKLPIPRQFVGDSGSTLVVIALTEGFDEVCLVGFDLGGKDMYVKNHEKRNKSRWIKNWRRINQYFGLEKIHFIGKDHKPFILSNEPEDKYAKVYMYGGDHLSEDDQSNDKMSKKVLVLGNGKSRLETGVKTFIDSWDGEIWGCNWIFKDHMQFPRLDRVGTVHEEVAREAYVYKLKEELPFEVYAKKSIEGYPYVKLFKDKRGWSSGSLMLLQALFEEYEEIQLAGFDFGGPDVYQPHDVEGSNFKKQFISIFNELDCSHVKFVGMKKPNFLK
jgi:hypothetical protein